MLLQPCHIDYSGDIWLQGIVREGGFIIFTLLKFDNN